MSIRCEILEYSRAPVVNGIIVGVKIVGTKSKNGRHYPQDVLARAIPLYERTSVYLLHPDVREKKAGVRRHTDHFGNLQNVHERKDGEIGLGLFGDLHIKQSHPMAAMILENLEGHRFGLSHNVIADMNDEQTEVLEIHEVNSVDLVDNPGATTNLFEETEDMADLAELKAANDKTAERMDAIEGKLDTVLESLQKKPEPEPDAKPPRLTVLEKANVDPDQPAPIGNEYKDFMGALLGFPITNAKGA